MQRTDRDNMFRGNNNDCRIYIGNLPEDCRERDVEDIFYKYGSIADVRIKRGDRDNRDSRDRRRGENLSYAFVQFDDPRDAEEAVRARDGYDWEGRRLRVEFTRGQNNYRRGGSRFQGRGRGRGVPPKRSNHRVNVKGLPSTGSWQDLKDHMREAGEVLYAEVYGDGCGIVEFAHSDDVRYALKNLDDTDFHSHEGESCRIVVSGDTGGSRRGRSYSRSRSRSRSPAQSRKKSRSRSKSKSRDHSKSRSKSPAKSRSRSSSRSPRRSPHGSPRRSRSKSPSRS